MRDILDKLTLITEATGLAGRKPGDPFQNISGETITFAEIQFFPEGGGRFTPEQLEQALQQITKQIPNIAWQNSKSAKTGGFALAHFNSQNGQITVGRYLNDIKPDPRQNTIDNSFVINGEQWKFASKSARKEQSGLSPLDLLQQRDLQDLPGIMNQLARSLGTDHPLYAVAHQVAMGHPLPFAFNAPEGIPFAAFRDYFCEILQPIALQKGQFTGNAVEAADRFLDGSFDGTVITFGATKTGGLTDSVITSESGKTLLISSKGGRGAEASTKNLYDEVQKLKGNPDGEKLLGKYEKEVEILETIVGNGQAGAPIKLAIESGLIDEKEADQLRALKNLPKIDLANVGGLSLSSNLKQLAKSRTTKTPESVNIYFHLMAAIAHKVADYINKTTNFPRAAADILNNGALVQVYTKAREAKGQWVLEEFQTVYPGEAIKGVFLSAQKNYSSTEIKGNFTFLIDKGQGVSKEKEETDDATPTAKSKPVATPGVLTGKRTEIRPTRSKEPGDVGRQKR